MLREGKTDDAKALLGRFWEHTRQKGRNPPWQLELTMGRVCYARGENARAWDHLSRAWQALEKRVPMAQEAAFSVSWMQDKDEVQSALTRIGCDLVQRGAISPEVLPALYDFSNGREISSRMLGARASQPSAQEALLANYRAAVSSSGKSADVFFFLEGESTVFVGHISASGGVEIIGDLGIAPKHLTEMRNAFRGALRMANPADSGDIEREIDGWDQVEARMSALVLSHTAAHAQILFLPGRALTGLPLHLMRSSAGKRLIEEYVVSYSPNFTTAAASHSVTGRSTGGCAVVCVTAQKDGTDFQQTALDAAARLVKLLEQSGSADYLKQGAADHRAVGDAMKRATEIVFLCHGTTAGFEGGYGICLADEGDLPPRVLSVEEFPEQAKFILSWRDIEVAPSVVASIACSSGLTEIGGGGVRFGLEQSLFSAGTHTIISPLWDVEQRSALSWVEQFYENRFAHSDWTIDRAYQQTCLDMRDQYRHFFFWGPFAMNVSAIGGKEAA